LLYHSFFSLLQFASSLKATTDDYNLISSTNNSNLSLSTASPIASGTRENETSALFGAAINFPQHPSSQCIFPSYFSHFAVLILIAISVVTQLSHLTKILLMIIVTGNVGWGWVEVGSGKWKTILANEGLFQFKAIY
jgi:hypothetical protein